MDGVNADTYIMGDHVSETKLIASLVLFVITLICGYLPVRMVLKQKYVQHAMFAGGGVLLATAFCHLIPETHDSFKATSSENLAHSHSHLYPQAKAQPPTLPLHSDHLSEASALVTNVTAIPPASLTANASSSNSNSTSNLGSQQPAQSHQHDDSSFMARFEDLHVPYVELTLCCGFFFMYLVEQLMLRFMTSHTHDHPCDMGEQQQRPPAGRLLIGDSQKHDQPGTPDLRASNNNNNNNNNIDNNSSILIADSVSTTLGSASVGNLSTTFIAPLPSAGLRNHANGATELYKFIRGLLIVSAFGTHSIFDGVAIGSQNTVEKVWALFVAISCHKLIIAAVVGFELFAATLESHLWTIVHLIIFSIMSPIGIILIVVAQDAFSVDSQHPSIILLQSFATGTLLYIIFFEILQPKDDQFQAKNGLSKSVSLIAGFALMLTVLTLIGH